MDQPKHIASFVNNLEANHRLDQLLALMAKDTHMVVRANPNNPHPATRRTCYNCGQPAPTAFYVSAERAFACPTCYIERYASQATETKVAS